MSQNSLQNLPQNSSEFYRRIAASDAFAESVKHYWGYQYRLARTNLAPYLRQMGVFREGASVIEIGCGEAGVLAAFVEAGASRAVGTDISRNRLEAAARIAAELGLAMELSAHDVLFDELQAEWRGAFDLVILRDVLEHLDDTRLALENIGKLLRKDGYAFIEFPPYSSPFGGHQHLLRNFWGKFPYVHLLPDALFRRMTASGWHELDIAEVRRLRNIRLTPRSFQCAAAEAGFRVVGERYYLSRPVFAFKFGLPTVSLTPLKAVPGVKEILSLEANYIIQKVNDD